MEYVWKPPKELVEKSNVKGFMDRLGIRSYEELVRRSKDDVEWFWRECERELRFEWFKPYEKVLDLSEGIEWAKWFVGGRINVTHNALDRHALSGKRNKLAFSWQGEDGNVRRYTYWDLYVEVNRLSNFLRSKGVKKGDIVAMYIPMLPETVVSLFAILKVGAIAAPIFSGFAPPAVAVRLRDAAPKVVITADGYLRRGKEVRLKDNADEALRLSGVNATVIVVKRLGIDVNIEDGRDFYYDESVKHQPIKAVCEHTGSEDPALLLYSSGTTGKPKGCVISHVGAIAQPSKEIYFNLDLKEGDKLMWITDIGWMMGPWQIIGSQHIGSSHMVFEGAPDYPNPDRIWAMVEDNSITHLGFSATVVRMLRRYGDGWVKKHDLSSLRAFGNTGEPIDKESWMWLMKVVGEERCPIINLSGGTEIFGCFLLPSPTVPLKPSTLWGPGLGMDVDVVDDSGKPLRGGEIGYLVCRKPAPSMTRGFWKDPERYLQTYWSKFKGIWYHGDWASIDEDGFWYLHGRADDTIKVAGRRLGPAEVEDIVNSHNAVAESACIGVPHEVKGEEIACFVVLKEGYEPSEELKGELISLVSKSLGKPFEPGYLFFVRDLPRTRSGKIMRRIIRDVCYGREPGEVSVLENPESVEEIRKIFANL